MFRPCVSSSGRLSTTTALALLISLTSFLFPQQAHAADQPERDEYRISVNVGLVILPIIVTDHKGNPVSGLGKDSFQVFEDGRPQQIALFQSEDVPITVGLVVDNSGSMAAKRPDVIAAAEDFAKSSNPHDEMFVVNFNQRVYLGLPQGVPFTSDVHQIMGALSQHPASGNTALHDGVAVALHHLGMGTANRKALIVISDGADNASRLKFSDVLQRAEAANVQIYTLGVFDDQFAGDGSGVLKRLAKVTGGKAYFPESPSQISGICQQIARDLRHQYTIGYHSSNSNSVGSYHAVHVTATAAGNGKLHVSTRAGYLMSAEPPTAPTTPAKASL